MKQFWAAMLAVAMLLSLSVTAGAGQSTNSGGYTISGGAFDTASGDTVKNLPMSGGAKGTSKSEGPLPEDPVEVIFPTIPAKASRDDRVGSNSGDTFGIFDIILDPHQLISVTSGARYAKEGVTKTFDANSRLYFLNNSTATTQSYTGESRPLQIINKGRQPVAVDLSVDFTYDSDLVTLVDAKTGANGLTMVSGDVVDKGAQMYFALKVGTVGSGDTTVSGDAEPIIDPAVDTNPDHTPYITVSGKGDYLYGAKTAAGAFDDGVIFTWDSTLSGDDLTAAENDLSGLKIKLTYEKPDTVMSGGLVEPGNIKVDVTKPSGYASTTSGDGNVNTTATVSGGLVSEGGNVLVTLTKSSAPIATILFEVVDPDASMKSGDDFAQVIQFKKRGPGVVVHQAIAGNKDIYKQQWVNPDGTDADHDAQGITDNGYYWKLDSTVTEFPTLFFGLEGDINNDHMWDAVDPDSTGISFELIWDVMQFSKYYSEGITPVETKAAVAVANGGAAEPVGTPPSITATVAGARRSLATITWQAGTGGYENYEPDLESVKLTGTDTVVTVTSSGQTLSYDSYNAGTGGQTLTITFKDSTGTFEKTVELTSGQV